MGHRNMAICLLLLAGLGLAILGCGPSRKDVNREINEANYCTEPADCVNVGAYCPFGCTLLVNADEEERIRGLIEDYYDAHPGEQCLYDCIAIGGIDCQDGECVTLDATR